MTWSLDGEGRIMATSAGSSALVASASYGPLGIQAVNFTTGHGETDSYSYNASTGRMSGYNFAVNGTNDSGTFTWSANGELSQFAVSDSIPGTADNGFTCLRPRRHGQAVAVQLRGAVERHFHL